MTTLDLTGDAELAIAGQRVEFRVETTSDAELGRMVRRMPDRKELYTNDYAWGKWFAGGVQGDSVDDVMRRATDRWVTKGIALHGSDAIEQGDAEIGDMIRRLPFTCHVWSSPDSLIPTGRRWKMDWQHGVFLAEGSTVLDTLRKGYEKIAEGF